MAEPLLRVENLRTEFKIPSGIVRAVRGVSFTIERGETVGIVGESGSGKSVTSLSLMGLFPSPPGTVTADVLRFNGEDLQIHNSKAMRAVRGKQMAMVFQDPFSSLNPTMTLGEQVAESIRLHERVSRAEAKNRVLELFRKVRIPSPEIRYRQYPHEISGGQRQRVMIAIAFACNPQLLIADEPTTALDVTVQAQVLTLMQEMQRETGAGIALITHDLGVVAEICDRVLVMYAGQIVESGTVAQIFANPVHPYTQGLLASLPQLHADRTERLVSIPGQPPDLAHLPSGCPFYDRCSQHMENICPTREPNPTEPNPGQVTRCFLYGG